MSFTKTEKTKIGEKLAIIRHDLSQRRNEAITGKGLSELIGHADNIIERMENGRGGQIANYCKLFTFYHDNGYNIYWIVAHQIEPSDKTFMYRIIEDNKNIELDKLLIEVEKLKLSLLAQTEKLINNHFDPFQMDLIVNQ